MTTKQKNLLERSLNWVALLVILSLGIIWPPVFANARADDLANVHAGSLLLRTSDGTPVQALRQSTRIRAQVTGNVARVHVTQTFENAGDEWVEGLYVFPLSAGAAVDELEMLVGERKIRGEIKRKQEARATYEKARSEGRRASLVDQERPNMFTTSVANIGPHSSITVDIAYLDTVPFRDGRYTLNLPLSITPRYTPGMELDPGAPFAADNARTANVIAAARAMESLEASSGVPPDSTSPTLTSGDRAIASLLPPRASPTATPERVTAEFQTAQIEVDLMPGFSLGSVRSVNHAAVVNMISTGRRITLQGNTVPADRDFELVWTPAVVTDTEAAAFAERVNDDTYVLVTLMPPQMTAVRAYRREVLFVIDTSGSMSGPSIDQARAALRLGVERLAAGDTFNIIRFSSDATSLFEQPQVADARARDLAERYIDGLVADGGTEMKLALDLAFATPPSSESLRQIVFVTDGSVSNEAELVKMIHERISGARLFTVGIGAAPNAYFMREAAAAGHGSYTFIPNVNEVRERMADVFRKLENPALVDLQLWWPGGAKAELATDLPGDVYAGDPLVIAARVPKVPEGVITLSGRSAGGAWTRQLRINVVGEQSGIAKLWARERIGALSRQKNFGGDAKEAADGIVQLALAHHLVSEFTSLVAVDVAPARPIGAALNREQAPTVAPIGGAWSGTTGFAPTATPAPLLFVVGFLALAVAVGLWLSERKKGAWRMLAGRSKYGSATRSGRWLAWKKQKPGVR
jgi:Ca-activated chloride channel family protein